MKMSEKIKLTINGKSIETQAGTTILKAAEENGIYIPSLCFDDCVEVYGACGVCVVEAEGIPKLLRACATKATDGMVINTEAPRAVSARKVALELLLSNHIGDCKAPCTLNCPADTDCQGYVGLIANGEYEQAIKLIKEKVPLPASIGRICPHPCEKNCRRSLVEEPVAIASLKSFAADIDLEKAQSYLPEVMADTGKTVAVIGGGPGGLSAAYYLKIMGHAVKVYDMMPKMGGMLRYGIPQYRLPKEILDKEIALIEKLGVELINNVKIGKDITFDDIRNQNDAVVVAIGAWKSSSMRVEGENLDGVLGGIDFLRDVALGNAPDVGKRVAVCGGGNTAMDACRTAVRLGAEEVYVIYRRTRAEMPAEEIEIEEALEEGVIFKYLTNPVEIKGENGKVKSVKLQIMELGEPDAGGRRSPVPVEGAFEEIELDTVIMAIGQKTAAEGFESLEKTRWGTILADENGFFTSVEGVFAAGDATNSGADIAISAIGEAKKTAEAVDAYLNGKQYFYRKPFFVERKITAEDLAGKEKCARAKLTVMSPEKRRTNFDEIVKGFSEEAAKAEAMRCLECGCLDYFQCKLINTANRYSINPLRFAGENPKRYDGNSNEYIVRNPDKCILCGLCVRSCEQVLDITALGLIGRGFTTVVSPEFNLPLDSTKCNACGLCVKLCPTGALMERSMLTKQVPLALDSVDETCTLCEKKCTVTKLMRGDRIVDIMPADKGSRECHLGRKELNAQLLSAFTK